MNIRPTSQELAKTWPKTSAAIVREPVTPRGLALRQIAGEPRTVLSLWRGVINVGTVQESMKEIAVSVARKHRVSLQDLIGPGRAREVSIPRQEAMWRMVETGRFSLPQIGRFLGGRDHTTILHGWRAHASRMASQVAA